MIWLTSLATTTHYNAKILTIIKEQFSWREFKNCSSYLLQQFQNKRDTFYLAFTLDLYFLYLLDKFQILFLNNFTFFPEFDLLTLKFIARRIKRLSRLNISRALKGLNNLQPCRKKLWTFPALCKPPRRRRIYEVPNRPSPDPCTPISCRFHKLEVHCTGWRRLKRYRNTCK